MDKISKTSPTTSTRVTSALTNTPVDTQMPTLTNTPIPTATPAKSDKKLLEKAFAAKYNKPVEKANVTISKQSGSYAQGGIKFDGEIAGGWFLAYKKNGKWIIVDDGNGTISCEKIKPYNFPVDMVPECVDSLGHLKTR